MPARDSLNMPKGIITRRLRDLNGRVFREDKFENIVTYSASNLIAKAISGDASVQISHIRIGGIVSASYTLGNKFSSQTTTREDTTMYYASNPNGGDDLVVTVPAVFLSFGSDPTVVLAPVQQPTNVVTFTATLGYSVGNGYTFDELGMYGAADATMFSHAHIDPIGKTASFQIEYEWALVFR
jgi:hypothetical protein